MRTTDPTRNIIDTQRFMHTDTFVSKDQDFERRINGLRNRFYFIIPVLLFALVVLTYSIVYHEGKPRRNTYQRLEEGLSYMDGTTIMVSITICIVLGISLYFLFKVYYADRRIIVGVQFNDKDKELTIKTKSIRGITTEGKFKYIRMKFERDKLSDGMTTAYETFTLLHNDIPVGHLFSNHFTWNASEYNEIVNRIKKS